ncbi:MAG: UDP-N-acetylmuramoyl-L-alanyl-D-glutamate--2,6-diaminopimelate ligase [Colwellia sp.]|nr:UDP-N-acetylmuramoyl-L-alanyl-D-glutamate--2,6-diaminopimelate ligase [Colwellia sp.]
MPKAFSLSKRKLINVLLAFNLPTDIAYLPDEFGDLVNDTRKLNQGDVFCAVIGQQQNGNNYIAQAIESGSSLIIAQCEHAEQHGEVCYLAKESSKEQHIPQIYFYQLNEQLYSFAKSYYQNPQSTMTIIGITGTNGKTSTSQIIAKLFAHCQQKTAVIGTNGAGLVDALQPLENTTPAATQLHQLFAKFNAEHIENVAMEISSHALEQGRANAELIDIAVFTNLSRDHLDYHKTMANYAEAKYKIFSQNHQQVAVLNGEDQQVQTWLNNWPSEQSVIVYGRTKLITQYSAFVQACDIKHHAQGVEFTLATHLGKQLINSSLIGDFNIDNLLAAIAVLLVQKISLTDIADAVKLLTPTLGRMEIFAAENRATAIVDYAHTPDALSNALAACRWHCDGELWVVFGCGGDRDKGKRPLMARAAEQGADHLIITTDNPRTEQAEDIVNDMLMGCIKPENVTVVLDRELAVLAGLTKAKANDMILFAGKGHEDYIIIGDEKINYNERKFVQSIYQLYNNQQAAGEIS